MSPFSSGLSSELQQVITLEHLEVSQYDVLLDYFYFAADVVLRVRLCSRRRQ